MKPILGLRTVIYHVPDLAEAKEWYSKAFETEPYFDEPFYVGFDVGGYELGILPESEPYAERTANVEAYWGVEDIHAHAERILKLGAEEHTEIKDVGEGILVTTLYDPWKNVIGLIYNPFFKLK